MLIGFILIMLIRFRGIVLIEIRVEFLGGGVENEWISAFKRRYRYLNIFLERFESIIPIVQNFPYHALVK